MGVCCKYYARYSQPWHISCPSNLLSSGLKSPRLHSRHGILGKEKPEGEEELGVPVNLFPTLTYRAEEGSRCDALRPAARKWIDDDQQKQKHSGGKREKSQSLHLYLSFHFVSAPSCVTRP